MLKNLVPKATALAATLALMFNMAAMPAAAQTKREVCEGVAIAAGGSGCNTPSDSPTVERVIKSVVNILSLIVGVVAVIMIIIGGLKYVLSSGDSNNINSAKNTILFAIVGLIVAALAQVIVRYVLNKVT